MAHNSGFRQFDSLRNSSEAQMDRRDFLKSTGTLIASATLAQSGFGSNAPETTPPVGRTVLPITPNCGYSRNVTDASHARDFDDSGYERVVIPHTNIKVPWHGFDEK